MNFKLDKLGQVGANWGKLGRVGASWGKLGQVGNQRNYRNLTFKKTSREEEEEEERKKKNIGYRVASNERRLKTEPSSEHSTEQGTFGGSLNCATDLNCTFVYFSPLTRTPSKHFEQKVVE